MENILAQKIPDMDTSSLVTEFVMPDEESEYREYHQIFVTKSGIYFRFDSIYMNGVLRPFTLWILSEEEATAACEEFERFE